jgi:hypothetical protein
MAQINPTEASHSKRRSSAQATCVSLRAVLASALVTAAGLLVHADRPGHAADDGKAMKQQPAPAERAFTGKLPGNVEEMRDYILAAIQLGSISELKTAIEWNELKPDFGDSANDDPIAYWKKISADGDGKEILADLANILALPPARLAIGKDPENNIVYVWPYLAELPLDRLTAAEQVDLYRLVPAAAAKSMQEKKKWSWWRLAIGADGTWLTFRKYD